MSDHEQNDVLNTEPEEKALFCRKCGQKLSPENNTQCAFCGTIVEYNSEVDVPAPEADKEESTQQEAKPKKKTGLIIGMIVSIFLAVGCGVAAILLLTNNKKVDAVSAAMN